MRPASLVCCRRAFSHNGFTEKFDGQNRRLFSQGDLQSKKITGPIVATHTVNDRAVGLAYALASQISGDNRLAIGDQTTCGGLVVTAR